MTAPKRGGRSPWGEVDDATEVAPGVWVVATASHGGIWLDPEARKRVSPADRKRAARWSHGWGGCWFEEDLCAMFVVAAFPFTFAKRMGKTPEELRLMASAVRVRLDRSAAEDAAREALRR